MIRTLLFFSALAVSTAKLSSNCKLLNLFDYSVVDLGSPKLPVNLTDNEYTSRQCLYVADEKSSSRFIGMLSQASDYAITEVLSVEGKMKKIEVSRCRRSNDKKTALLVLLSGKRLMLDNSSNKAHGCYSQAAYLYDTGAAAVGIVSEFSLRQMYNAGAAAAESITQRFWDSEKSEESEDDSIVNRRADIIGPFNSQSTAREFISFTIISNQLIGYQTGLIEELHCTDEELACNDQEHSEKNIGWTQYYIEAEEAVEKFLRSKLPTFYDSGDDLLNPIQVVVPFNKTAAKQVYQKLLRSKIAEHDGGISMSEATIKLGEHFFDLTRCGDVEANPGPDESDESEDDG